MIGSFWIGQIPQAPLTFSVQTERREPVNLSGYTSVTLNVLDTDNQVVDLTDGTIGVNNASQGVVVFNWPTTSIFNKTGDYVFQLELSGNGKKDYTSQYTVRVRKAGEIVR